MSHKIIILRRMASKRMAEKPEEFKAKSKTSFVRKAKPRSWQLASLSTWNLFSPKNSKTTAVRPPRKEPVSAKTCLHCRI